jgi:ABC transporter ATM
MASPPPKKDDPPKLAVEKRAVESESVTAKEQRQTDWRIIKTLVKHVWPKNDWKTRGTVVFGFGLLISSKVGYTAGDMH